jgi:hypothetical protein
MKKILFTLVLLFSLFPDRSLYADGNRMTVLFPEIPEWELSIGENVYTPGNLWDIIDGAADAYLSYDFIDLHLADYSRGDILVHVELYRHDGAKNTFGIYTSERSPDYHFIDIGTEGYSGEGILNFLSGEYYVKLYSTSEAEGTGESIRLIAGEIDRSLAQENSWPAELGLLPEEGRIVRTERYIARNFLGFDFLHSAFLADYSEGGEFRVFIIHAGGEAEIVSMLERYLDFTGQPAELIGKSPFVIKDPYNGDILVSIHDDYLCGVQDCGDPVLREKYLELLLERMQ